MNGIFMKRALELAKCAATEGEIPVGAVIVKNGLIIGEGRNMREQKKNVLSHAEIEAINGACQNLKSWRLDGCEIYVTLEPCSMCAGAIINSRISEVVFGAYDLRTGCFDSVINLSALPLDSKPLIFGGIYEEECVALLTDFFKRIRNNEATN